MEEEVKFPILKILKKIAIVIPLIIEILEVIKGKKKQKKTSTATRLKPSLAGESGPSSTTDAGSCCASDSNGRHGCWPRFTAKTRFPS